jgi:hypothetical protein
VRKCDFSSLKYLSVKSHISISGDGSSAWIVAKIKVPRAERRTLNERRVQSIILLPFAAQIY